MKIECSANKGVMEREECLTCARRGENVCGMDYSLLAALYDGTEDRSNEIHVTDLLSCPRKVYLQKTNPVLVRPHEMLSMFKGLAVHDRMERSSRALPKFPPVYPELPVMVDDLIGRVDLIYMTDTNKWRLIDIKTAKELYPSLLPYSEHGSQINLYAWMLGKQYGMKPDELYIQYISMAGPTMCKKCRVTVEWTEDGCRCPVCGKIFDKGHLGAMLVPIRMYDDKEVEEVVTYRKSLIKDALANQKVPDGEPGWLCKRYCPFLDQCQAGMNFTGNGEEE